MRATPIYVEIDIAADVETVWELTQRPELHTRWDARFSRITPLDELSGGGYRFRYERRMPLHTIVGTGTSIGERLRPDGTRTSALRFTTADRLSPLGDGRGYWRYLPIDGGTRFITGFDYAPAWAETGRQPRSWYTLWGPDAPRASRCRRQPRRGDAMTEAPATLAELEHP